MTSRADVFCAAGDELDGGNCDVTDGEDEPEAILNEAGGT
jgi:hypothetical protein